MLLALTVGLQLVFLLANNCAAANEQKIERNYIIVIDAGSTGSRIHVYPYVPSTPLPIFFPEEEFTVKKKPGLSSFQDNPSQAGDSLGAIFQEAKDHIPASTKLKNVPIFLLATAGLRRVQSVDPAAAKQIMSSVRSALKKCGFRFKNSWARIIEGVQEGSFGWVTVNYLLGNLENPDAKTTGVFEMGGESVQLTFLSTTPLPKDISDKLIMPVHIAGRTYNLVAHSWMGYGMEAMQAKFDDQIDDEESSPCYLTGDVRQSSGTNTDISYKGEGNYVACYLLLKDMLRDGKGGCQEQDTLRCSLNGLQIPQDIGEIVLIENFYYTANVAGFTAEQMKGWNYYSRMQEFGKEFCGTNLGGAQSYLSELSNYQSDEGEIHKECFCAAYVNAMIKEGVGLASSDSYEVVRNIKSADLDWALGYAVVQITTGVTQIGSGRHWFFIYLALLLVFAIVVGFVIWRRTSRAFPRYGQLSQKDIKDSTWNGVRKNKAHQSPEPDDGPGRINDDTPSSEES